MHISTSSQNTAHTEKIFRDSFTASEGSEEGALIEKLVHALITTTPAHDINIYEAEMDGKPVASAIFTKIRFAESPINSCILAPLAVLPRYQKQGVGKKLLQYAHEDLRSHGVMLAITYGDIRFYSKVGYVHISPDTIPSPLPLSQPEGWLAQSLTDAPIPQIPGTSSCVPALNDPVYW